MKPISFKEAQDVEFVKAHVCGTDGLIPSVHLDESTLPKKVFPYYVRIDGKFAIVETPEDAKDKENSHMFITYKDDLLDDVEAYKCPKWLFQISTRKVKWRGVTASLRRSRRIEEYWEENGCYYVGEEKKPPEPDFRVTGITINDTIIEVLFANRIVEDSYGGYRYYMIDTEERNFHEPNAIASEMSGYATFGTIISPFPVYMVDGITELKSFRIRDEEEIAKEEASRWINRKIVDFDVHEGYILQKIEEIASQFKNPEIGFDNDAIKEYFHKNSYTFACMLKNVIGGGRGFICVAEDLTCVWTNIVTGRSYDINGRRSGFMAHLLLDDYSDLINGKTITNDQYKSLAELSKGKFPNL